MTRHGTARHGAIPGTWSIQGWTRSNRGGAVWVHGPFRGVPGATGVELYGYMVHSGVYPWQPGRSCMGTWSIQGCTRGNRGGAV